MFSFHMRPDLCKSLGMFSNSNQITQGPTFNVSEHDHVSIYFRTLFTVLFIKSFICPLEVWLSVRLRSRLDIVKHFVSKASRGVNTHPNKSIFILVFSHSQPSRDINSGIYGWKMRPNTCQRMSIKCHNLTESTLSSWPLRLTMSTAL